MRNIYYREQIVVDGAVYDVAVHDYSDAFEQRVADGELKPDAPHHAIVDWICADLETNPDV